MAIAEDHITTKKTIWRRILPSFMVRSSRDKNVEQRSANAGTLSNWNWWRSQFGISSKSPEVNEQTAQSIPALYRAWSLIAEQIASLPLKVYERQDGKTLEAKEHPIYSLLKYRPHPLQSSFDFRQALVRRLLMRGDSYARIVKSKGDVSRFDILDNPADVIEMGSNFYYRFTNEDATLRSDEVLHFKLSTIDGIKGQNPLALFEKTIQRAIAEIEYGESYYSNGAHLSGLLIPERNLTPEQSKQLRASWEARNSGRDNTGKTGVVPFGVKYQQLGVSNKDSEYIEGRRLTVEDIANITGVSPALLGSGQKTAFANNEQQNRAFVEYTIRTYCRLLESELNSKLFTAAERGKYFVEHDLKGLLQGDTIARANLYQTMYNVQAINPNEIRALENMNPYEGGDEYGKPFASNVKENDSTKE